MKNQISFHLYKVKFRKDGDPLKLWPHRKLDFQLRGTALLSLTKLYTPQFWIPGIGGNRLYIVLTLQYIVVRLALELYCVYRIFNMYFFCVMVLFR